MKGAIVGLLGILGAQADNHWLHKYADEQLSNKGFEREFGTKVIDCVYEADLDSKESVEEAIICVSKREEHVDTEKMSSLISRTQSQRKIDRVCTDDVLRQSKPLSHDRP